MHCKKILYTALAAGLAGPYWLCEQKHPLETPLGQKLFSGVFKLKLEPG